MSNFLKLINDRPTATAMALTDLPSIANNTVLGNIYGSASTPSALSLLPSILIGLDRTINAQTGTTYTFVLADGSAAGGNPLVTASNSSPQTYTVPSNSSVAFPVGTQIDLMQQGTGSVTIAAAGGVTINSQDTSLTLSGQYAGATLIKTATNVWTLITGMVAGTVTSVALTVPSFLSVSGSPITGSGTFAITLSGTALPIANGGTAATTAQSAFDNLSPLTTTGDTIYYNGTHNARLAIGSTGNVLTVSGGVPTWAAPATSGTVTSVALSVPSSSLFGVSGSPVTSSGTLGLTTTGTSGGIPYFSSTSQLSSSALLTASQLVLGGGAGTAPSTLAAGTQYQVLTMVASNPAYGAVNLGQSAAVTGVLPSGNVGLGRTINAQTGTTYTFVLADGSAAGGNTLVTASNASAQTYTVPPNSSVAFPVGTQIDLMQLGAGVVTVAAGAGVTINSNGGLVVGARYVGVTLIQVSANSWVLVGNLT